MQLSLSIKKLFILVTIITTFWFSSAWAAGFETKAKYAMLYDYNTDTVLYEKNADVLMEPSSMTKIMTSYLIFDALKRGDITMETEFLVSEKAWKKGGSKMFVKEGDDVTVNNLLHGIIVQSGNDACIVIAEGLSGSEEAFAEDMNFMAKEIGMTSTNFRNSTGWPDTKHVTTARDLVTLAKRTMKDFPEYYTYYAQREFTYAKIQQFNRNKLLGRNIGVDGFKTGYTGRAGYGIVVSAEQDGRRLVLAINGLSSSKVRLSEAERILRHGFRDFKNVALFKKNDVIENVEVWMGRESTVPLVTRENIEFTTNKRASMRGNLEMSVSYNSPWPAPIKKGTHIANLTIKKGGKTYREVPLYAGKDVEKASFFGSLATKVKYYISGS